MLDEALKINLQPITTSISALEFVDAVGASDETLVRLSLAGDESAFAEIFNRYRHPVARTVGRFFRDRDDVQEFVQQGFTKAYFSLKQFRGGDDKSFAAWITRITVNVCYDEFRRRQRNGENALTELGDAEADYLRTIADARQASPETSVVAAQVAEKLLAALDAPDRVAMMMVYSEDCSLEEAADAIGISTSNLKSRLFRCRKTLKARFGYLFR